MAHTAHLVALPSQIVEERETRRALHAAVCCLPSEYRLLFRLCYWDEMPQQQIAEFLGLPLTTVRWRLHHGKKLLRVSLKQKGG